MKTQGLTEKKAARLLVRYGENKLKIKEHASLIVQFFAQFKDLMVVILIIAAAFSILGGEKKDGGMILFIVILNAVIGFIQKYKAEKAVEALHKLVAPHAKVIRNGKFMDIEARFLVPGDLVVLSEGDLVPADCILTEANELKVDESILTGESVSVGKKVKNEIFMGTMISHGTGKATVKKTGMTTKFGNIANMTTTTEKDKSPLEKELHRIGIFTGKIAIGISAILLAAGVFVQGKPFVYSLLFAVAVAVAAVPEGLPATITISLALGVQKLAKKNAIMKQLSSVETLGSTTVICSDKTGTLTKNELTVMEIFTDTGHISMDEKSYKIHGKINEKTIELISKIGTLCNDAKLEKENGAMKIIGDPTEGALLIASEKLGFETNKLDKEIKKVHEIPFDSIKKRMAMIVKDKDQHFAFIKGAPDIILQQCTKIWVNGEIESLDIEKRERISNKNEEMAKNAMRVLAFAYKEAEKRGTNTEEKLIFVCLTAMMDPLRPEVKEAVASAKKAGIRTYIVTGDHGLTAYAIAKEIGLVGENVRIITGEEFEKLRKKELKKIFKNKEDVIFARSRPEQKLQIVNILKELGEVVAVTGDGVNDAPALKRADIGIAMGIKGTDVSREAANMVLADDSYGTIVTAIEEGRTIYENLKKFVFYTFSCNMGELFTVFAGILLGLPMPLTAVLILAVDLGTDVLPAIALGVDPPEKGIMEKKPRSQKERIMNKGFVIHFLYLGVTKGIIVVSIFIWSLMSQGWKWGETLTFDSGTYIKASTMAFAILVIIQMMNTFNVRSETKSAFGSGMKANYWLVSAIMISIVFTVSFIEIPYLQDFLGTKGLTAKEWLIIIVGGLLVLVIEEIRKFISNRICLKNTCA